MLCGRARSPCDAAPCLACDAPLVDWQTSAAVHRAPRVRAAILDANAEGPEPPRAQPGCVDACP